MRYALGVNRAKVEAHVEGQRRENRQLVRSIDALDVESWVGLGVAQCLCLRQRIGKGPSSLSHRAENEVRRAVDDAGQPLVLVGRERPVQARNDGYAAGHCRFEAQLRSVLGRQRQEFVTVQRNDGLVSRDDRGSPAESSGHELQSRVLTTDELDEHVDVGTRGQRNHVGGELGPAKIHLRLCPPAGDLGHLDFAARAAGDAVTIGSQHLQHALRHGA